MSVFRRARARLASETDPSRVDFTVGFIMAWQGYSADQIGAAIEEASPELDTRKAGHAEDYLRRTVRAIFSARDRDEAAPEPDAPRRDPDQTPEPD